MIKLQQQILNILNVEPFIPVSYLAQNLGISRTTFYEKKELKIYVDETRKSIIQAKIISLISSNPSISTSEIAKQLNTTSTILSESKYADFIKKYKFEVRVQIIDSVFKESSKPKMNAIASRLNMTRQNLYAHHQDLVDYIQMKKTIQRARA